MGKAEVVKIKNERVVRVTDLTKGYREHTAVRGLNLEINRGEIYGIIGPDGSGKSSLMKAVAGVLTFDAGEVEVFGIKIDSERAAEQIKDRIGFMPQGLGLNLYPELSVEENIDFFARLRLVPEKEIAERKQRLLSMARLDRFRERPMKNLSGGMKQKLGLICSLIHEPELVILDEPTTGVDPISRRDFWTILSELLRERGITAVVSTAYMDEAVRFHRMSLLFGGRILAQGEPGKILRLVPGTVAALQAEPQIEALARLKAHFPQVNAQGPWLRVFMEDADHTAAVRLVKSALAGIRVNDIHITEPELEDVFIALLHKRGVIERGVGVSAPAAIPGNPQTESSIAIEAIELVRDFGKFRAVDRVSFSVRKGEIFGLLGANGAGKTTVIKMLTGILPPTGGEGRVAGADMRHAGRDIKESIGYMSQAFSLYRDLSVVENIRLYAGIYGLNRSETRKRMDWVIDMAGLVGHETDLSGSLPMGLRQRLALGCALVHRPQILFLDEPTSGVDPIGRRHLWEVLFRLSREEGVTVLVTTHYMSEAEHCDHLVLMFAGRQVADASPVEMKKQVEAEAGHLMELVTDQPTLALGQLVKNGFSDAALFGNRIHVFSHQPESDEERISQMLSEVGINLNSVALRPLSMEDVFVYRVTLLEKQELLMAKGGR
jgi:ABC-type multidrug transport system ATPase subunit